MRDIEVRLALDTIEQVEAEMRAERRYGTANRLREAGNVLRLSTCSTKIGVANMELRITLAPDGGLRLILPAGRSLDIGERLSAIHFIKRILTDVAKGKLEQRGYIQEFPTQHVIDIWRKQDAEAKAERAREEFREKGIDLEELDFQL